MFSARLRELRLEHKLTQREFAAKLGLSASCYAGYEQGYREPDLDTLRNICLFLNVSADYLLGLEDEAGAKLYGYV